MAADPAAVARDAVFASALQRGYSTVYSLTIEGIPWVFTEASYQRSTAGTATPPTDYDSAIVPALMVSEGMAISIELSRSAGVASGKALEVVLSYAALESAGLLPSLFSAPTAQATLTADVDEDDTVITVDDSTDIVATVSAGGHVWLGRECLLLDSSTSTTLTVQRAQAGGLAYLHRANTPSSYGVVTSSPSLWRGRIVRLYEHLASPEGRLIDAEDALDPTIGLEHDYCRLVWSGTLDATPQPSAMGMMLRCLPLVRLAACDLGFATSLRTYTGYDESFIGSDWTYPVYVTDNDTVRVDVTWWGTGSGSRTFVARAITSGDAPQAMRYSDWWQTVVDDIRTACAGDPWYVAAGTGVVETFSKQPVNIPLGEGRHWQHWTFYPLEGYNVRIDFTIDNGKCYWLQAGKHSGTAFQYNPVASLVVGPMAQPNVAWLPVVHEASEDVGGEELPQESYGVAEAGDVTEILGWAEAVTVTSPDTFVFLRLWGRGLAGTPQAPLWQSDATIKGASGVYGRLDSCILTLLESSGTGLRGDHDTLSLGQGLGVPAELIDVDGTVPMIHGGISSYDLDEAILVQDGRSSLESSVGGWLALQGLCLAQADGRLVLVSMSLANDPGAQLITKADVILDRIEPEYGVRSPNSVKVDPSGINGEKRPIIVRDTSAIQAEGYEELELSAPGAPTEKVVDWAWSLIRRGRGESLIRLRLAPWARVRPGQQVRLNLEHPLIYDWATGTRAPTLVGAVVLAVETSLYDGTHQVTLAVEGQQGSHQYLCPCAVVATVPTTTTITVDEPEWFRAGETVTLYNPGSEDTEQATATVTDVTDSTITVSAALPAWVDEGTVVTFPPHGDATNAQGVHAYVRAGTRWR